MPALNMVWLLALLGVVVLTLQGCDADGPTADPGPEPEQRSTTTRVTTTSAPTLVTTTTLTTTAAPTAATTTTLTTTTLTTTTAAQTSVTTTTAPPKTTASQGAKPWCAKPSGGAVPPVPAIGQPIGWPPTAEAIGQGWCQVSKPPPGWNLQDYCNGSFEQEQAHHAKRFLSPRASTVPATAAASQIKVLTYNLYWWNLFQQRHGNNGEAGKNIAHHAVDTTFDLMGFQECEDALWPLRDAKEAGMTGSFAAVPWEHALAIAYNTDTLELLEKGAGDVAEDQQSQYYGKRGAMWVRLSHKATNKKVFFMNHHGPLPVNSGGICGPEGTAYNLLKMIAENAKVGDSIVLVGDFNAWSTYAKDEELSEIDHIDCHLPHVFNSPVLDDWWGIDNIFANCATPVEKIVMPKGGSDHFALSVLFEL